MATQGVVERLVPLREAMEDAKLAAAHVVLVKCL